MNFYFYTIQRAGMQSDPVGIDKDKFDKISVIPNSKLVNAVNIETKEKNGKTIHTVVFNADIPEVQHHMDNLKYQGITKWWFETYEQSNLSSF